MYTLYIHYHTQTQTLTPSEENFLDAFMKGLYKINPSLHRNLTHMKRVGIFTWILSWGVYSNAKSISKIKDSLHTLQEQNKLQDKQIKHLARFLNLTMHQVSRHSEMLYGNVLHTTHVVSFNRSNSHTACEGTTKKPQACVIFCYVVPTPSYSAVQSEQANNKHGA